MKLTVMIVVVTLLIMLSSCKPEMTVEGYFENKMLDYEYVLEQETTENDQLIVTIQSDFFCSTEYDELFYELDELYLNDYRPSVIDEIQGACDDLIIKRVENSYHEYYLLVGDDIMFEDSIPSPSELGAWLENQTAHYEETYCDGESCEGAYDDDIMQDAMDHFALSEYMYNKLINDMDEE